MYYYLSAVSAAQYSAQCFVNKLNEAILFPLITLLLALAFLVFLFGLFEYVRDATSDAGREKGKQHILYGTIGMFIMLSAYAILSLAAGTFGIGLFNADQVACEAGPGVTDTTPSVGVGGTGGFGGGGPVTPGTSGVLIPGDDAPTMPELPTLETPDTTMVDTLPEVDTSTPPCPPNHSRIDGMCTLIYPFEIRNNEQIEVSCLGESSCVGAINACNTHYGGVYSGAGGGQTDYVVCNDSNFSQGPVRTVVYGDAPEGMFEAPEQFTSFDATTDAPPEVPEFEGWVSVGGNNVFVTPEFEANYETYVEPHVTENTADEQAILNTYAEFGATEVLFMVPLQDAQTGGTLSQVEARCRDLNGGEDNLILESGADRRVTSVDMYACLR